MDNVLYITNDKGEEIKLNILLTFDMNEANYVIVYEDGKDDLYPFLYDDNGNLLEVESEEDLELIQEVVDAFLAEKEGQNEEAR